jgi:FkbM family methyltransferase
VFRRLRANNYYALYYKDYSRNDLIKEKHLKEILRRIILYYRKLNKFVIFIDVGSYLGEYVEYVKELASMSIAIEAHPDNYTKLCNRIASLGLQHIVTFNYAICNFCGTSFLYIREETTHSLIRRQRAKGIIRVKCMTLTSLLRSLYEALGVKTRLAVVVKIDIEGAELGTLLSLTDCLPASLILMVELHGSFNQVFVPLIVVLKGFKIKLIDESHVLLMKVI